MYLRDVEEGVYMYQAKVFLGGIILLSEGLRGGGGLILFLKSEVVLKSN